MPKPTLTAEILVYDRGVIVARFSLQSGAIIGTILGMNAETQATACQTLSVLAGQYEAAQRAARKSPQYIAATSAILERVAAACGWLEPGDMAAGCNAFEDYLAGVQERSTAKTRNNYLTTVRAFTDWLVHREAIASNPFTRIPMSRHFGGSGSRALSPVEMAAMIEAAERDEAKARKIGKKKRSHWYRLARATGLRAREMSLIRIGDFDLSPGAERVIVPAEFAKARKVQILPLAADDARWIAELAKGRDPRDKLMLESVPKQHRVNADAKAAGLFRKGETIGLHSFRKGYVSAIAASGAPMSVTQALARHSDPRLTSRVYVDQNLLPLRAAVDRVASTGYGQSVKSSLKVMDNGEISDTVSQRRKLDVEPRKQPSHEAADDALPQRRSFASSSESGASAASDCVGTRGTGDSDIRVKSGRQDLNLLPLAVDLLETATRLFRLALERGVTDGEPVDTRTTGGREPPGDAGAGQGDRGGRDRD